MGMMCQGHDELVGYIQELSMARSLEGVTEIVRRAARALANADGATVVLRDGDHCHYVDEDAIAPLWKGLRFPLEACVSGMAMISGRSIAIPDIYKDARVPLAAYRPTFVKSLLMTPIRRVDAIGAIGVYWAVQRTPTLSETRTLESLANATSTAIENTRLHEELREKVAELERHSRQKDQFLLMLSHELRTPMNSILGWSSLLQEDVAEDQTELRQGLESIHRNAKTEMRLIADLLDSTQFLLGRLTLEKAPVDLNQMICTAAQSIRSQANLRRISLEVHGQPQACVIEGDADRLQQVIGNLLSNAMKFTPQDGCINLSLRADAGAYVISVEDNGEGIDADRLANIFDRFQSQTQALTRRHGGLGLGLAIVKSLVNAHGGSVSAKSRGPGAGARFEVRLPHSVMTQEPRVALV